MSELRWQDGGQPSVPDPNHDRHVAFPDEDPFRDLAIQVVGTGPDGRPLNARISLAPSVQWGWRAGELPGMPRGRWPRRRRRKGGVVAILIALGLMALLARPGGSAESSSDGGASSHVCFGDCSGSGALPGSGKDPAVGLVPAPLQVTPLTAGGAEGLVETEPKGPVVGVPSGPSSVRVEVVSNDGPSANVTITNESGGFDQVVSLPFAAQVTVPDGTLPFRVAAVGDLEDATIQCRVYVGSTLVATSRDLRSVECSPEPATP